MIKDQTELARKIEAVVGGDHVTASPALEIDGITPALLVKPGSTEEAAECLKACAVAGAAVIPAGLMSWIESGNPLRRADVVLSLERMNRIIEYSPPDLTATVEAGLALSEFNAAAGREGQWLPLDPPGAARASVGAIAACNSSGGLRLGFGTPRDYIIGLRLAHADGTVSKSGGRVVKNVAGYDMNKLYVGSFGTLAVLTELTFKLRPAAERASTIVIASKHPGHLSQLAGRVIASELKPASILLARRLLSDLVFDEALIIRFIESEAAVKHQLDWVTRAAGKDYQVTALDEEAAASLWTSLADFDQRAGNAIRMSVPVSSASDFFERLVGRVATADLGAGIIRVAFDAADDSAVELIERDRAAAAAVGGTLFIERAPQEVRRRADAWGDVGATEGIMREIKAKFDPQSLLSPGRFVSGI